MLFDILIIGNGILGLSTAYALSLENPSLRIGIIGPHNKVGSASLAAGAMLGCFGEVTDAGLESKHGQAKLDIAVKSSQKWPRWISQINDSLKVNNPITIQPGTFLILNSNSGTLDDKNYNAIIKALQMYKEPYQEVDPREIPGMHPSENSRPLRALYMPNEGSINASNLIQAFYKLTEVNKNIKFIDDLATEVTLQNEKIISIKTKTGNSFSAGQILLAAGAYSQNLLDKIPQLRFRIPRILYGSGSSLILKSPNHKFNNVVRSPNRAGACGAHIVPHDNNTLYMGASNNLRLTEKTHPKGRDIYYLLERAIEQFNENLHNAEVINWRVGNRPVTIDTYPLVGKTSISNLWLLTGTYRDGIHTSVWWAEYVAKQMLSNVAATDNYFIPERKPIFIDKRKSIECFIEHYMSAGYEHSIKLPKIGWSNYFKEVWENRIEKIYSALETDLGLPPDVLIMLDQEKDYIPILKEYLSELNQHQPLQIVANEK